VSGRLEAIWLKRAHRGPMDQVTEATLVAGRGLVGNADQGRRRQVTVIERELWDRMMAQLAGRTDPSARRANFMISGCRLAGQRRRVLRIGDCRVRILGETRPCERMDEALPGLRAVMGQQWGGGSFGEVLDDGVVMVGAEVRWENRESPNDDGRLE
jgi:MOSC domain-containing protein YiiM